MQPNESLEFLAERAQEGDARARTRLRDRLERQMGRITRRALGVTGASTSLNSSTLTRKIQMAAHRLDRDPTGKTSPHLARQVASNLCQTVVNRIWTGATEGVLQTVAT